MDEKQLKLRYKAKRIKIIEVLDEVKSKVWDHEYCEANELARSIVSDLSSMCKAGSSKFKNKGGNNETKTDRR